MRTEIHLRFLLLILLMTTSGVLLAQIIPAPPQTDSLITCFPDTTGYNRITVGPVDRDYTDLQDALNAASLGTVIVLDAGHTFSGEYTLPYRGDEEEWIILISSRMDLLSPEHQRIDPFQSTGDIMFPTQADAMPKIVSTTSLGVIPAVATAAYASQYRLVGIEVTVDESITQNFGLINFGSASTDQNTLGIVPHDMILDRCYVHGHSNGDVRFMNYGIALNCKDCAVVDSYFSELHSINLEAQAITCINGPGPFKIINNYLEAAGQGVLIGGGAPAIHDLVLADIEVRQNHFFKPYSWWIASPMYAGKHWTVKNHFEMRTGLRVLFDGNLLENCWADLPEGQSGYAIQLAVNTENGSAMQANVGDVMISNNIIRSAGAGITITGKDGAASNTSERIMVSNNLFEDIDGPFYGDQDINGSNDGTLLYIGEPMDVTFDHNTLLQTGVISWAYDTTYGFQYTNNLSLSSVTAGGYQGIYGPGQTQGNATFATYFPDVSDLNMTFNKNVLIGGEESFYTDFATNSLNYFPAGTGDVGFVDYPNGDSDYHNYALRSDSPYAMQGTDGLDIGVNFDALDSAFAAPRVCELPTSTRRVLRQELIKDVFPNPTSEMLYLQLSEDQPSHYTIYDMHGQKVLSGDQFGNQLQIDVSSLSSGVFVIGVQSLTSIGYTTFVRM